MDCSFIKNISDPSIKTILLCGCGGGFDFTHSSILIPLLKNLKKKLIFASFSFTEQSLLPQNSKLYYQFKNERANCHIVKSDKSWNDKKIEKIEAPEVHFIKVLNQNYPEEEHFIYSMEATYYNTKMLKELYEKIINDNEIDAIITIDGGSDSLMKGNEYSLGSIVEDSVTISAISNIKLKRIKQKILGCIGMGCDRFHGVSDAATFRAISELKRSDGFLGGIIIETNHEGYKLYKKIINETNTKQEFHSIIANSVLASIEGSNIVPQAIQHRVSPEMDFWPLMGIFWFFNCEKVKERSEICKVIEYEDDPLQVISKYRQSIQILPMENLPKTNIAFVFN
jgi:hypothetical protein